MATLKLDIGLRKQQLVPLLEALNNLTAELRDVAVTLSIASERVTTASKKRKAAPAAAPPAPPDPGI